MGASEPWAAECAQTFSHSKTQDCHAIFRDVLVLHV
jgi:hypothetical protein